MLDGLMEKGACTSVVRTERIFEFVRVSKRTN